MRMRYPNPSRASVTKCAAHAGQKTTWHFKAQPTIQHTVMLRLRHLVQTPIGVKLQRATEINKSKNLPYITEKKCETFDIVSVLGMRPGGSSGRLIEYDIVCDILYNFVYWRIPIYVGV